jgi:hypothetical protein
MGRGPDAERQKGKTKKKKKKKKIYKKIKILVLANKCGDRGESPHFTLGHL